MMPEKPAALTMLVTIDRKETRWLTLSEMLLLRAGGFVGASLDCSGTDRGEARAVAALRDAGMVEALHARDAGDVDALIDDPERDPRTGIVGFEQIREASRNIRAAVGEVFERGERPLVVGGDCTILVGALAAAKERTGRLGLAFLDGHVDFFDGRTSPSGEAADMDLASSGPVTWW